MLPQLLLNKIYANHYSLREAARQIGISHTSVKRVLDEASVDLDTLDAVARWVGVPLATVLELRTDQQSEKFLADLQMLTGMEPELRPVFEEIFSKIVNGRLDARVLSDVVAYAKYQIAQQDTGLTHEPGSRSKKKSD